MQRKKSDKLDGTGVYQLPPPLPYHRSKPAFEQPPHDSSLAHSTASIIQMLPSDSISSLQLQIFEQAETVFESSYLHEKEGCGGFGRDGSSGLQNNYNYALAKPKKKYPNRLTLAYNFSNISLLHKALAAPLRKITRIALESIRSVADAGRRGRQKNRGSFCSGYTTSSTNGDDRMFRKQNKEQLTAKRQQKQQEAAHMINGWVEYKERMTASFAFKELLCFAKNRPLGHYLLESTIRNDAPVDNFCLTDYKQDESISLARLMQIQGNVDESLVYTADHMFQFTQREAGITPEKFKKSGIQSEVKTPNNNRQSYVQSYRPMLKMHPPLSKPRKDKQQIDYRSMALKKPIPFNSFQQRRYLLVRTNIYEMPLNNCNFNNEPTLKAKQQPIPQNYLVRAEADSLADMQDISKELDTTMTLFKSTKLPKKQESLKNIENGSSYSYYDHIRDSTATYFTTTVNDKNTPNSDNAKTSTEKVIRATTISDRANAQTQIKRVQSINNSNSAQDKKPQLKIDNYYFSAKQLPTNKIVEKVTSNAAGPESQSNKIIQNHKKVNSANSFLEILHKDHGEPKFRFEESLVNGFSMKEESEYKQESKISSKLVPAPPVKRQDQPRIQRFNSGLELTLSPNDKNKRSIPKINMVIGSPRQNIQPVVQTHKRIDSSNNKNINKDIYSPNIIYDYPAPLSSRPSAQNINKPKLQSPISKDKHILSPNHHPITSHNNSNNYQHPSQLSHPISPTSVHNLYQLNHAAPQQHTVNRIQTKIEPTLRKPSRVDSPSRYGVVGVQSPTQPIMLRSEEKKALYFSPETQREIYGQKQPLKQNEPQRRPIYHTRKVTTQQHQQVQQLPQPSQEYFMRQQPLQAHQKTVNLTNNYYIAGPPPPQSTIRQPPTQTIRNVFQQQSKGRKIFNNNRPSSMVRQSSQRGNLLSNYSPHDSEVESQHRSNNFSRNSSELSRPRSMNEKIHLTLKIQHK